MATGLKSMDFREMTDQVERIVRKNDKQAFATLFDFFAPRINSYLRKMGLEPQSAEEITQEVMLVLWCKAHLFDPAKSSLSTWLYRIARNRHIDLLRKNKSHLVDANDPLLLPVAPEPQDHQYDARTRDARIRAALQELPREQRETIRMAFFLGYSHSRITEETGLPMGTVKSRIRLAFSKLKIMLEEDARVDVD